MAFFSLFLLVSLIMGLLEIAIAASLVAVMQLILAPIELVMKPVHAIERAVVQPYKTGKEQLSQLHEELKALKGSDNDKKPNDAKVAAMEALKETLTKYRDSRCSQFVDDALVDFLNLDWKTLSTAGRATARPLSLLAKPEYIGAFAPESLVHIESRRSVLFVPLSTARQLKISQIQTKGTVILFNDGPNALIPQDFRMSISADTALFICDRELPSDQIKINSSRIVMESPENLKKFLDPSCDESCERSIRVFGYRSSIESVLEKVKDYEKKM